MLTLPQNGSDRFSEDLKFQDFLGEDAIESPLLKAGIRASCSPVLDLTVHKIYYSCLLLTDELTNRNVSVT